MQLWSGAAVPLVVLRARPGGSVPRLYTRVWPINPPDHRSLAPAPVPSAVSAPLWTTLSALVRRRCCSHPCKRKLAALACVPDRPPALIRVRV